LRNKPQKAQSLILAILASTVLIAGCRQDMHDTPRYEAFEANSTFADNRASRTAPAGTVARGWLRADDALYTGKIAGQPVDEFPFAIGREELVRGQQRFNIYCTPCHDSTGSGNGMVVQRGYRKPPSLHEERLRLAEPGYFVDVITNGFGVMPDYRVQVAPRDRWAIAAYIRALQLSQRAAATDVPGGDPAKVPQPATPPGGGH
jgi:mono/diheme cytochrome c family protein